MSPSYVPDVGSWGGVPTPRPHAVHQPCWRDGVVVPAHGPTVLAYGMGRSYGDVCMNDAADVVLMRGLHRVLAFDRERGILRVEAGATFREIYDVVLPHGWFLPVVPGTMYVTVGGAVANDIHGKNHGTAGTFGCHVLSLELVRSDGRAVCSPTEHDDWFRATIGGLGLTGIITWVEIQLQRIPSAIVEVESLRTEGLADQVAKEHASGDAWEFTVGWMDTVRADGRGVLHRGRWWSADGGDASLRRPITDGPVVPFYTPNGLLSKPTIAAFNSFWYHRHWRAHDRGRVALRPFFHPLDMMQRWNRLYGRRGMLQYQFVIPAASGLPPVQAVLDLVRGAGMASFLTVVKRFGARRSPGILSFPMEGVTVALDLPNTGVSLLRTLDRADDVVLEAGGRIYAAKDARTASATFRAMMPMLEAFVPFVDQRCSSTFWRRITGEAV